MRRFASRLRLGLAPSNATAALREGHIVRQVDPNGFRGDFREVVQSPDKKLLTQPPLGPDTNTLFTGCANTGKLTSLRALGKRLEEQGKRVAWISADPQRAFRLNALPMTAFLGLRAGLRELPIREQMEATFERHMRLMKDRYEDLFLTIENADALMFDALHAADPTIIQALDAVCRRARGKPGEAFGGLRVHATADFWRLPVHLSSPFARYAYQLPEWDELFPAQVLLDRVVTQDQQLSDVTQRAFMGTLTKSDIELLESTPHDDTMTPLVDNLGGFANFQPKFPRQPSRRTMPPRTKHIRGNDFGAYLLSVLADGFMAPNFGLVERLSLNTGHRVHLTHAGEGLEAGALGTVEDVMPFKIRVRFDGHKSAVSIPPMRCEAFHSDYPDVKYTLTQFPLFPRTDISPMNIVKYGKVRRVSMDCGFMTDANDVGNVLAQLRTAADFHCVPGTVDEVFKLDGFVHEPTRIYYQHLALKQDAAARAAFEKGKEQFCRNCKKYVAAKDFYAHWNNCVATQRWCPDTDQCVPLPKWEAHNEKLQVVLCIDCGKALEWKNWELHRLSCNPMLREITTENEFLPTETRNSALALGYDRRDLHNMKAINRSSLPKTRRDLRAGRAVV